MKISQLTMAMTIAGEYLSTGHGHRGMAPPCRASRMDQWGLATKAVRVTLSAEVPTACAARSAKQLNQTPRRGPQKQPDQPIMATMANRYVNLAKRERMIYFEASRLIPAGARSAACVRKTACRNRTTSA